jgi:hypothetical protein
MRPIPSLPGPCTRLAPCRQGPCRQGSPRCLDPPKPPCPLLSTPPARPWNDQPRSTANPVPQMPPEPIPQPQRGRRPLPRPPRGAVRLSPHPPAAARARSAARPPLDPIAARGARPDARAPLSRGARESNPPLLRLHGAPCMGVACARARMLRRTARVRTIWGRRASSVRAAGPSTTPPRRAAVCGRISSGHQRPQDSARSPRCSASSGRCGPVERRCAGAAPSRRARERAWRGQREGQRRARDPASPLRRSRPAPPTIRSRVVQGATEPHAVRQRTRRAAPPPL